MKQHHLKTPSSQSPNSLRKQAGVTLVEVMVAMLVTTAGLLGFAGLQTRALTATEDAYLRTQAMTLAQDMLERMRINGVSITQQSFAANSPGYAIYADSAQYNGAPLQISPSMACIYPGVTCTATALANFDIRQLRIRAASMLPSGTMLVQGEAAGCSLSQTCVYVAWGDTTAESCADEYNTSGTLPRQCVVTQGM